MKSKIVLKRSDAALLIKHASRIIAENDHTHEPPAVQLKKLFESFGVEIPVRCTGQAHLPEIAGNIDHCSVCMPSWGWMCPEIKIS